MSLSTPTTFTAAMGGGTSRALVIANVSPNRLEMQSLVFVALIDRSGRRGIAHNKRSEVCVFEDTDEVTLRCRLNCVQRLGCIARIDTACEILSNIYDEASERTALENEARLLPRNRAPAARRVRSRARRRPSPRTRQRGPSPQGPGALSC